MLILISPAKTLDYQSPLATTRYTQPEPVSYTHLDVYKRQVQHHHLFRFNHVFHRIETVKVRQQEARGVTAVSYTHLDVYKRQGVKNDFLEAEISYGKVGRPERIYHGKQTYPEQR